MSTQLLEDSIQCALILYWQQNISDSVANDQQAFVWLLTVANRHLYKEMHRDRRLCGLAEAKDVAFNPEQLTNLIQRDIIEHIERHYSSEAMSILRFHQSGYRIKEIAMVFGVSTDAMKQRHQRITRSIRNEMRSYYS